MIDQNAIGNEGAKALAEMLETHKSITEVGIDGCLLPM